MPLYTYRCASGHAADLLRGRDVTEEVCACGGVAVRAALYAVSLGGRPDVRYRLSDYVEADGELKHAAARDGITPRDMMADGMRKARAARGAGVRP